MTPQLVVPMTGVSARFTAAGYRIPKFLVELEGQTVVEHVLDMFPGWDDVVLICNTDHLDDPALGLRDLLLAKRPSARIVGVPPHRLGPGHAVLQAADEIDRERPVVVSYCDFTCYWDADRFADRLSSGEVEGLLACYRGFHPHMGWSTSYAYPRMDGDRVVDIQEKQPWTDDPASEPASSGTYGFASGQVLLDALERQVRVGDDLNGEYYLSLTYRSLLAEGLRVEVHDVQHFMQWGTPQDLEEYRDWSDALRLWSRGAAEPLPGSGRVVLASGAGQRFADRGYALPKPLLDVGGRTMLEQALLAVPGERSVVVTRRDLPFAADLDEVARSCRADVVQLEELSRGQADSARYGLAVLDVPGPVTVTSCDAVPRAAAGRLEDALVRAGDDGLVVWTAPAPRTARTRPEQYGWVLSRDGAVVRTWLKAAPDDVAEARVVIGTFTFPSVQGALADVDELLAGDDVVNGEYYLDSLVGRLLEQGRRVVPLDLEAFAWTGTPDEYETFRYWQSCFHKWALHPYSFAADPLVPVGARADLDHAARRFPTGAVR